MCLAKCQHANAGVHSHKSVLRWLSDENTEYNWQTITTKDLIPELAVFVRRTSQNNPIPSMYGTLTYIWLFFVVNVYVKYAGPIDPTDNPTKFRGNTRNWNWMGKRDSWKNHGNLRAPPMPPRKQGLISGLLTIIVP